MNNTVAGIAYIMGLGRSGTTILSVLLENSPDVVSAGEVTHLFQDGYVDGNECTCGQKVDQCLFWRGVVNELGFDSQEAEAAASLFKKLDWHSGFRRAYSGAHSEQIWQRYQAINRGVFHAISEMQSPKLIVDSSKYAARALNLQRVFPGNTKVICVLRSPEGLIHSFIKPNKDEQRPKSLLKIVVYYYLVMWSLFLANKRLKENVIIVNYETLIEQPITVLERLEKFLDVDLSVTKDKIRSESTLEVGHIVTGNRLRKNKALRFKQGKPAEINANFRQKIALVIMRAWRLILGMKYVE